MSDYVHFNRERPSAGLKGSPPRMTRAELEAATKGHFAAGPATATVIEQIGYDVAALARIDERAAAGQSLPEDGQDHAALEDRVAMLLRRLGLYTAAAQ